MKCKHKKKETLAKHKFILVMVLIFALSFFDFFSQVLTHVLLELTRSREKSYCQDLFLIFENSRRNCSSSRILFTSPPFFFYIPQAQKHIPVERDCFQALRGKQKKKKKKRVFLFQL